jgi:hypothetical protein
MVVRKLYNDETIDYGAYFLQDKASNFAIPFAASPDDKNVTVALADQWGPQKTDNRTYATGAFEIQVLLPLRMKPPSVSSHVVSIPAGSEP